MLCWRKTPLAASILGMRTIVLTGSVMQQKHVFGSTSLFDRHQIQPVQYTRRKVLNGKTKNSQVVLNWMWTS